MKLATFRLRGEQVSSAKAGIVEGDVVYEVEGSLGVLGLLAGGSETARKSGVQHRLPDVVLHAPLPRPGKIVAAIVNTQGMLGGDARLDRPRLDTKAPSTVIGQGEDVVSPPEGIRPEVELAAVIGSVTKGATEAAASKSIFGYTILNDVTAPGDSKSDAYEAYRRDKESGVIRKVTMRGPLFRSKNHDTFCPMGPWIVTSDEFDVKMPSRMKTTFNGKSIQDGTTSEYLFAPARLVSYVSGFLTLEPGDIVSCGSVGWAPGALGALDPTEYLLPKEPGLLSLEIERIGTLENRVVFNSREG